MPAARYAKSVFVNGSTAVAVNATNLNKIEQGIFDAQDASTTDATWYVAKWGSDANDGLTQHSPLLTLGAAAAKQPVVTTPFGSSRRATRIYMAPGDYHESAAIIFNKAANLELIGTGGSGGAKVGSRGGTTIYTPVGVVGITVGIRNDSDTSWLNSAHGCTIRNIHVRPETTDTSGSTGIKIIGLTNCLFENVTVNDYSGTSSKGWHLQSNDIANGGSAGATMYNLWSRCGANTCTTGFHFEGSTGHLNDAVIDGNGDVVTSYLAGSTGILCTSGGGIVGEVVRIQAVQTAIDQSQSHGAGVVYRCDLHELRMEACLIGVRSNQLQTAVSKGTFYSGALTAGTAGTIAFDMQAGAEFAIHDVAMPSGVATTVAVASGATGYRDDPATGRTYWGTKLRGVSAGKYAGLTNATPSTPTGAMQATGGGTSPSAVTFTSGSTDMVGEFSFTTGTGTAAGTVVRITYANAFPGGAKPIVLISRIGTANNAVVLVNASGNTTFDLVSMSALTASTAHTFQYAVVGVL